MTRNVKLQVLRMLAAAVFTAVAGISAAHGGGGGGFSGGDSGDSSMNPFTGDSYAYFHGGHNLGEQGTIRPNRPNPRFSTAQDAKANVAPAASAADQPEDPKRSHDDVPQQSVSR
jgi:hypothetical protein